MEVYLNRLKCQRCSHSWVPRTAEVRVCPKCHSPYWDRGLSQPTKPFTMILNEMVRRIVAACDPEKIILFGSHATGHAGPDSDVDLLVVMQVQSSRRQKATEIDTELYGIPLPVDVLVVTPQQLEQEKDLIGSILHTVVSEGQTLYERAA